MLSAGLAAQVGQLCLLAHEAEGVVIDPQQQSVAWPSNKNLQVKATACPSKAAGYLNAVYLQAPGDDGTYVGKAGKKVNYHDRKCEL